VWALGTGEPQNPVGAKELRKKGQGAVLAKKGQFALYKEKL
jgi:hypothetical protein